MKFDELADIKIENNLIRWLERAAFALMILMFAAAPHSIAVTNIGWLLGMFFWFVRLFFRPRPRLVRTPLDVPLWAFFGWSFLSSIFSYEPLVSLDKLRLNVILFLIFYFVVNVARTKRAVVFLAAVMILSAMVSVAWTPIERIVGRGVQISDLSSDSPLTKVILLEGDTLLKANNRKIKSPEDLVEEIQKNELTDLYVYRPDFYFTVKIPRADLLQGANAVEQLGIGDWKPSRNWRSAGFYGHYTTFAEVLQLIASLVFGLFIAAFGRKGVEERRNGRDEEKILSNDKMDGQKKSFFSPSFFFSSTPLLLFCLAAMSFALLLTVTRASQLGFLISAAAMVLLFGGRRMVLISAAIILPVALVGLVVLQQSRQIGFFDREDESITWRQTVYREAFDLWTRNPRHFLLGVGMDSAKTRQAEWRLFDDGKLPSGHFHSTPLQIAVERGLPALLLWLWILYIYARTLLKFLNHKSKIKNQKSAGWRTRGIVLGSFGGMIGFSAAGLVHYNLGDAEVAMVFFMLMGLSVAMTSFKLRITN